MSLLLRNYSVHTRYGGGFVQSIDGVEGGEAGGQPHRLVLLRQRRGGARRAPRPPTCTRAIASGGTCTTGARPRTCRRSSAPTRSRSSTASTASACRSVSNARVEAGSACGAVATRLQQAGVPAAIGALGRRCGPAALRVLVGPWRELRVERRCQSLERGPRASGVYATPNATGTSADAARPGRSRGATRSAPAPASSRRRPARNAFRSGLSPARTRPASRWRRARSSEATLRDRFAVAVTAAGPQPLPVAP